MHDVDGWVAVVTGAASGIGLGMARAFTSAGMQVVLADIEQEPLDAAADELTGRGHEVLAVRTDVSKLEAVQALADATIERFGRVNVLCNNAGVATADPVWATSVADWRWTLDVNLWGPIHGVHVFVPLIQQAGEGHVNSTASMAGLLAPASLGAYNVSKHAVVGLMATLARDLRVARSPVSASVLCPGPINTNILTSERNRDPVDAAQHTHTEAADRLWSSMSEALSRGMDPDQVGPMVLDAIRTDRFWVFTHPSMLGTVERQLALAGEDGSLLGF